MMEEVDSLKIDDIVLNLKLVAKIKQNEKMIIINKTLGVDNRFIKPILRWYTSDNRIDTILFIENLFNKAFECLSDTKDCVYDCDTLKKEMLNTISGLENLSATYKLDNLIISKIDILKEKITKMCN
jgi:hypothetical protein